jgi:iron complex transport system ATP-binding protein
MDLMEALKTEQALTVVLVSHDINLAAMYGDQVMLLKEGRVVAAGTPQEVLTYQTLEATYGCRLLVDRSPLGNFPCITPVPRRFLLKNQGPAESQEDPSLNER